MFVIIQFYSKINKNIDKSKSTSFDVKFNNTSCNSWLIYSFVGNSFVKSEEELISVLMNFIFFNFFQLFFANLF